MPHSPRWHDGRLWVLNSGTGHLGTIDLENGAFKPLVFCPGFLRGRAFHNGFAVVALSQPRQADFMGLELENELQERGARAWCGVHIVNLDSGDIVEWIRFESGISELFDVQIIRGVRWPVATGVLSDAIKSTYTFETPKQRPKKAGLREPTA